MSNTDPKKRRITAQETNLSRQAVSQINEWFSTYRPLENEAIREIGALKTDTADDRAAGEANVRAQAGAGALKVGGEDAVNNAHASGEVLGRVSAGARAAGEQANQADATTRQRNAIAVGQNQQGLVRQLQQSEVNRAITEQTAKANATNTRRASNQQMFGTLAGAVAMGMYKNHLKSAANNSDGFVSALNPEQQNTVDVNESDISQRDWNSYPSFGAES